MESASFNLFAIIPHWSQKDDEAQDLGAAYNGAMELLPNDGDWAVFLDHDASFTTPNWNKHIREVINHAEDARPGLMCCMTNAVACDYQRAENVIPRTLDYYYHRGVGAKLEADKWEQIRDITDWKAVGNLPLSGVLMVVNKWAWSNIGGFKSGHLGVDNDFHKRMADGGFQVWLLEGLYVMHWYRGLVGDTRPIPCQESQKRRTTV